VATVDGHQPTWQVDSVVCRLSSREILLLVFVRSGEVGELIGLHESGHPQLGSVQQGTAFGRHLDTLLKPGDRLI
jgi:hypothetical protein